MPFILDPSGTAKRHEFAASLLSNGYDPNAAEPDIDTAAWDHANGVKGILPSVANHSCPYMESHKLITSLQFICAINYTNVGAALSINRI
jgi:hypothetical protein